MLKLASIFIGEDPARTANYQPGSQRKVKLLASCLLLPVLLWFINGYLLVSHVLAGSAAAALFTAVIAALLVFLIERAVIMANGHWVITMFRIVLGIVVALLGSVSLDEVVFKQDIDNQMATYQAKAINTAGMSADSSFSSQLRNQQRLVATKYQVWQQALSQASTEADGTTGSGIAKVGRIAQLKLRVAAQHAREYDQEKAKLATLQQARDSTRNVAKSNAQRDYHSDALLLRLKAMFELLQQDTSMLLIYLLFTAFLFCLEFIVVLIKSFSKVSVDEQLEAAAEQLLLFKARKTLESASFHFEPALHDAQVLDAQTTIRQVRPRNLLG